MKLKKIQRFFDWANCQVFDGKLPRVKIVIKDLTDAYGQLQVRYTKSGFIHKKWLEIDPVMCMCHDEQYDTIDVVNQVIVHEMVHLFQLQEKGIKPHRMLSYFRKHPKDLFDKFGKIAYDKGITNNQKLNLTNAI